MPIHLGVTPVPIPNTTVKTQTAEGTTLVTMWENRWVPDWYYTGDGMGEQVDAGKYGGVAQLGEHLPCKQGVKSSNLSISIL